MHGVSGGGHDGGNGSGGGGGGGGSNKDEDGKGRRKSVEERAYIRRDRGAKALVRIRSTVVRPR